MLSNYHASTGVVDIGHLPSSHTLVVQKVLETVTFDEVAVFVAISKLKPNLSLGPDNILHLFFSTKLKYFVARPLALQ